MVQIVGSASDLAAAIDAAVAREPALRHLQSIVVSNRGDLVAERYYRDRRPGDLSNVHSITKSVVATLAGIAVRDGHLDLSTKILDVFDVDVSDGRKREITIEHLLTMTSGLDAETPYDIDEIADRGESWIEGPLAAPLRADPGTTFAYNNGAVHVLAAAVGRAAGVPLVELAAQRLFVPLGIEEFRWPADPEGNALGYGHLELRPSDLLRLGDLYLERGRFGGLQILDAHFVDAAFTLSSGGGPPEGRPYGYLWWLAREDGYEGYFAGGYGGQYVTVVPALDLVVVTTADAAVFIETSYNTRRLVSEVVVPHFSQRGRPQG